MARTYQRQIEMTWRCSSCGTQNLGRHQACQNCGDPKDASEHYEMPTDTAAAQTVTDPGLLRMAHAGANWQCAYCGSHQRAYDGSCGQCGAAQVEGNRLSAPHPAPHPAPARRSRKKLYIALAVVAGCAGLLAFAIYMALRPRNVDATVASISWRHRVEVERYKVWDRQGFDESIPSGAFDRVALGERHHHDDQVLDGYDTVSYYESVRCGETCTTVPEVCRESCSSNSNGFATCTTRCTGGGQSCTPKYCQEQRTRQEPRYRKVPVYKPYSSYRVWDWGVVRTVDAGGQALPTRWPSADEIALGKNLGEGENERERRSTSYQVVLTGPDDGRWELSPDTQDELATFPVGSVHPIRVYHDGRFELLRASDEP